MHVTQGLSVIQLANEEQLLVAVSVPKQGVRSHHPTMPHEIRFVRKPLVVACGFQRLV
jgi:hypothetical protein